MPQHNPVMTISELQSFMDQAFPQMKDRDGQMVIDALGPMTATVHMGFAEHNLRPGGTLSGPSMMGLADYAMYAVLLAHIGPVALAVTTNLNINFLQKPGPSMLYGEARLLKLGRRLAVGEVSLLQDGVEGAVAHVTLTYSIPPRPE